MESNYIPTPHPFDQENIEKLQNGNEIQAIQSTLTENGCGATIYADTKYGAKYRIRLGKNKFLTRPVINKAKSFGLDVAEILGNTMNGTDIWLKSTT